MHSEEQAPYRGGDLEVMRRAGNYHTWLCDEIAPFLGDRVAEVGAGQGNFTSFLLGTDLTQLTAFEPAANMFEALRARFRGDPRLLCVNSTLGLYPRSGAAQFDSVVYVNVLEHIRNDGDELALVHDWLRVRGHLVIFVPAMPMLHSAYERALGHHRRYRRRGLVDLVTAAGFALVRARYFDCLGVVPWFLALTVLRRSLTSRSVSLYDRLCIPVVRRIEALVEPPFGKNLLLIATKPPR